MRKALGIYIAAVVIMTVGMLGATRRMLRLERSEQLLALKGENERLALWRMESQLLPMVLRENSRRFHEEMFNSSALYPFPEEILCYFRGDYQHGITLTAWDTARNWGAEHLSSNHRALSEEAIDADTDYLFQQVPLPQRPQIIDRILGELDNPSNWQHIASVLGELDELSASTNDDLPAPGQQSLTPTEPYAGKQVINQQVASRQEARNQSEFFNRSQNSIMFQPAEQVSPPLRALWFNGRLALVRRMEGNPQPSFAGCVLDWEVLRDSLLKPVVDLLPDARLVPLAHNATADPYSLASLPVRLIPGEPSQNGLQMSSALRPTLLIAWTCFVVSAIAIGLLLAGVVQLSERRAAFVSAVTHELRTPLTSFRLYVDLLGNPVNLSGEKQHRYIEILKSEANRLQYLIENVLAWSRLERSAETQQTQVIQWLELLETIAGPLRDRAAQAGMTIEFDTTSEATVEFLGNATAVERILHNLVDNACKYARSESDQRIHISATCLLAENQVAIAVRDHGSGIADEMKRKLFHPFSKSAQQAARTAPGIGLGLSLSRRLARDMAGDLVLDCSSSTGTTFVLMMPVSVRQRRWR